MKKNTFTYRFLLWGLPVVAFLNYGCSDTGVFYAVEQVTKIVEKGLSNHFRVSSIAIHHDGSESYVYVAGPTVWRRPLLPPGNTNWTKVLSYDDKPIVALAVKGSSIYAGSGDGVQKSTDGKNWSGTSEVGGSTTYDYLRAITGFDSGETLIAGLGSDTVLVSRSASSISGAPSAVTNSSAIGIDLGDLESGLYLLTSGSSGYSVVFGGSLRTDKDNDGFTASGSFPFSREFLPLNKLGTTGFLAYNDAGNNSNDQIFAMAKGNRGLFLATRSGGLWKWERE